MCCYYLLGESKKPRGKLNERQGENKKIEGIQTKTSEADLRFQQI